MQANKDEQQKPPAGDTDGRPSGEESAVERARKAIEENEKLLERLKAERESRRASE